MTLQPLTIERMFLSWTLDVPVLLVVALLGFGYVWAARRTGEWRRSRTVYFCAGLATVLMVTVSFVGVYADSLFWVRAVQTVVLLMITPLLLVMGAPLTLLLATVPERTADRLRKAGRSVTARVLTFPLVVTVVLVAPTFVLYFTPLYEASLRNGFVDDLVHVGLVGAGFVYFWTRLGVDPTPRSDSYLVSLWISLTEVIADGALGLVVWLGPLIASGYYQARTWGPDIRLDQIIGAGVLWIGGDLAGLMFVGALVVRWRRDDERKAEQIDRELDEQERVVAKPGLWWENDPQLAERFRRLR
ncbi:cytochrome c oxidase assembly protein [Actinocrispum wychmicini]|uniref:Cytochrome c oxidase assembly factor CtaG n=1 Tax=Actinocrispum wychmicini TaxID=1213861 RepID=A0A4R2JKD0_9PSEU|nr:cytochrome c oxidase assembly protein [Actinocrispum wychmicini]TCO60451.1 cytochrome c oxidase assembly factor CtaG [Actinocrispum wychmicini]